MQILAGIPLTGSNEFFNTTGQYKFLNTVITKFWNLQFSGDLSSETKGIYFIKVSWEAGSRTRKIVMQ